MPDPHSASQPRLNPDTLLAEAERAGRRGEQILAFDIAQRGLEYHPGHLGLQRQAIYALILSGASDEAHRRFTEFGLAAHRIHPDIAALEARLIKESAFSGTVVRDADAIETAARSYQRLFERTQESYYGLNAASLYLIAGNKQLANELAQATSRLTHEPLPAGSDEHLQQLATRAEAALLMGDDTVAADTLDAFMASWRERTEPDIALLTTVRQQLKRLQPALPENRHALLNHLQAPGVLYYCGRTFTNSEIAPSPETLNSYLTKHNIGFAYGALSCGADILCAEAIITAGIQLHLVLPFSPEIHQQNLPTEHPHRWSERFSTCLAGAQSVSVINRQNDLVDQTALHYALDQTMGRALLLAHRLDTQPRQLALTEAIDTEQPEKQTTNTTNRLVQKWQAMGLPSDQLHVKPTQRNAVTPPPQSSKRFNAAIIFGDVKGFSQIPERRLPDVLDTLLPRLAAVLEEFAEECRYRNTWGDGLFLIATSAQSAAKICTRLHQAVASMPELDDAFSPPEHLALRLAIHYGPVQTHHDAILGQNNVFGNHVSRTARIEPITPPGQTYVTDAFAAQLNLERGSAASTEYVGTIEAAKDYGRLPMYVLKDSLHE